MNVRRSLMLSAVAAALMALVNQAVLSAAGRSPRSSGPDDVYAVGQNGTILHSAESVPPKWVSVDIKPGSCPNPLNRRSRGVLPVALVGSQDFDVSTVDADTILLSRDGVQGGVPPVDAKIDDVATPFDGEPCGCHDLAGDGTDDLVLKFRTQDVVAALDLKSLAGGEEVLLTIAGDRQDGRSFTGKDCVLLVPRRDKGTGEAPQQAMYTLTILYDDPPYGRVVLDPPPSDANSPTYPSDTEVTLTAEPNEGAKFQKWKIWDAVDPNITVIDKNNPITIDMVADRQVKVFFQCGDGGIEGGLLLTVFGVLGLFVMVRRGR